MDAAGARRRRVRRRSETLSPGRVGGPDLISALPEDLLLQVLVRLRSAAAAARTSLLSRRWRGLWTRLPDLVFRDVPVRWIRAALSSLQGDHGVSLLDIAFTSLQAAAEASLRLRGHQLREKVVASVPSLLDAAAGISPAEFRLALPLSLKLADTDLHGFHRTTLIQLCGHSLCLTLPRSSGAFPKLEELSLSGCSVDLAALVLCCPRLRVLRVSRAFVDDAVINIQSELLQKLVVRTNKYSRCTDRINIQAPMLKQLTLTFCTDTGAELSVSVVAPSLEKVSWGCSYTNNVGFAPWGLSTVRLYSVESLRQRVITATEEDTSLQLHNVYVLSLQMTASGWFLAELNFVQQIERHLVTDFSVLELRMVYDHGKVSVGHIFGPFMSHLLGIHRIRTATQRLQIHFLRPKVTNECPAKNCRCDKPSNWRSKNISLINLEDVEIKGFVGEDHEFDFLRLIFGCAPMLKRISLWMSDEGTTSNNRCMKIHQVFKEYPFVECNLMQR